MRLVWDENAWGDYVWWQAQDRKVLKRINTLIQDIERNGNEGVGKPEPLKDGFQGYWSRQDHRGASARLQSGRKEVSGSPPVGITTREMWAMVPNLARASPSD